MALYDGAMKKILLVTLMAACGGGGSGVDSGKLIKDLSVAEGNEECNYLFDTYPQKTVTCPDNSTVKVGEDPTKRATTCNETSNTTPAGCTATVGQAEQCIDDLYNEAATAICSQTIPPSCGPVLSAACQGTARIAPMTATEVLDLALKLSR